MHIVFAVMTITIVGTRIQIPEPGAHIVVFPVAAGNEAAYSKLARRLAKQPIAVLAPGNKYAGYGISSDAGNRIDVFRFNWYAEKVTHAIRMGEQPVAEEDEFLSTSLWQMEYATPNRGEAVEWAIKELASHGVVPGFWQTPSLASWSEWIAAAKMYEGSYDSAFVERALRKLNLPLP